MVKPFLTAVLSYSSQVYECPSLGSNEVQVMASLVGKPIVDQRWAWVAL